MCAAWLGQFLPSWPPCISTVTQMTFRSCQDFRSQILCKCYSICLSTSHCISCLENLIKFLISRSTLVCLMQFYCRPVPYKSPCSSHVSKITESGSRSQTLKERSPVVSSVPQGSQLFSMHLLKQPRPSVLAANASQWAPMRFHQTSPLLAWVWPASTRTWSRCAYACWHTQFGMCGRPNVTSATNHSSLLWLARLLSSWIILSLGTRSSFIISLHGLEMDCLSALHFGQAATQRKIMHPRLDFELLKLKSKLV